MNRIKQLSRIVIVFFILVGLCGCANTGHGARKESDAEYIDMMKAYMEEKYSTSFEIVESILPGSGLNSGMEVNVLVLRDGNGRLTNVRAKYGTPYNFYDDYVQSCTAAKLLSEAGVTYDHVDALGLNLVVRSESMESLDTSPENIPTLTVVAKVSEEPNMANMQSLYEIYEKICAGGYESVYFLVGFVEDSSDFDAAVENYTVHGKSKWEDYNGEFFAYLRTTDPGLSFADFCSHLEGVSFEEFYSSAEG